MFSVGSNKNEKLFRCRHIGKQSLKRNANGLSESLIFLASIFVRLKDLPNRSKTVRQAKQYSYKHLKNDPSSPGEIECASESTFRNPNQELNSSSRNLENRTSADVSSTISTENSFVPGSTNENFNAPIADLIDCDSESYYGCDSSFDSTTYEPPSQERQSQRLDKHNEDTKIQQQSYQNIPGSERQDSYDAENRLVHRSHDIFLMSRTLVKYKIKNSLTITISSRFVRGPTVTPSIFVSSLTTLFLYATFQVL